MGIEQSLTRLVKHEQALLGLADWRIEIQYETMDMIAAIEADPEARQAVLYIDKARIVNPPHSAAEVVDHELAHLIINPYPVAQIDTGGGMDDILVGHISRACELLRQKDLQLQVQAGDSLEQLVERARYLTWLTENNWRIYIEEKDQVEFEGEALPAFAYSNYYNDFTGGWALFSAREIILEVDRSCLVGDLPDIILRCLWRVVFNPYGAPHLRPATERGLDKIMGACKGLGWGK